MDNFSKDGKFLIPHWPTPANIHAAVSLVPSGLDLAITNPNQDLDTAKLIQLLKLPAAPIWLQQEHGKQVVIAKKLSAAELSEKPKADACISSSSDPTKVCAVLTADCVPILLANKLGTEIAAIHAGWRGQVSGIIETTVRSMQTSSNNLLAWVGPAISSAVYEVGEDVHDVVMQIIAHLPEALVFQKLGHNKWLFDMYTLIRVKLRFLGIPSQQIFGGPFCTYTRSDLFYSYRRDQTSKRMATLIWFK